MEQDEQEIAKKQAELRQTREAAILEMRRIIEKFHKENEGKEPITADLLSNSRQMRAAASQELREKVEKFRADREKELEPIIDEIIELEALIEETESEVEQVRDDILELQNSEASEDDLEWMRNQRERLKSELNALRIRKRATEEELSVKRLEVDEQVQNLSKRLERGEIF
ncbi:unnamed protein product [Caenorhabditis auriculariae]|uniref:Uncharacterized protein n=1 Tax=Caenorhabditis auriculariae TaxID=2777116 RepID=A0A8S1HBQ8_9PELO|nr:unnamed protein product [Caenorhabditis auriculariae]